MSTVAEKPVEGVVGETEARSQAESAGLRKTKMECEQFSLNWWCVQAGRDSKTVLAGLRRANIEWHKGEKLTFRQIEAALYGEEYIEKVRGLKLDNDEKEREKMKEEGNLLAMAEVEQFLTEHLHLPLASAFAQMPNDLAPRLAGASVEQISAAIANYIETKIKPPMRERLRTKGEK